MTDFFFQDVWRMDWGLGNPNKTAALIACGMVGVWALAWMGRWGFWVALVIFTGLGVCLVHTFSRGGLIGVMGGLSLLVFSWQFPGGKKTMGEIWKSNFAGRLVALVVAAWIVLGAMFYLDAHKRYVMGMVEEDRSVLNRLDLWSYAPAMMVDAPGGWGFGESVHAFMNWYQPLDRTEHFRTMVNSHLEWMVELGWPGRLAYVAGWAMVLVLCWPGGLRRREMDGEDGGGCPGWFAAVAGMWVAFGVCATFSSVAEEWLLWILPVLGLLAVVIARLARRSYPSMPALGACWGVAVLMCAGFWIAGSSADSMVRLHKGMVIYGTGEPAAIVVGSEAVVGSQAGRSLRRWRAENDGPTLAVGRAFTAQWMDSPTPVLICGEMDEENLTLIQKRLERRPEATAFLNPGMHPLEVGIEAPADLLVYAGAFGASRNTGAWRRVADVQELAGTGQFVGQWPGVAAQVASGNGGEDKEKL